MTTTEKKYAKYVGKLILVRQSQWDYERNKNRHTLDLAMIVSVQRKYGTTGHYVYQINTLKTCTEQEWRKDFRTSANSTYYSLHSARNDGNDNMMLFEKNQHRLSEVGVYVDEKEN